MNFYRNFKNTRIIFILIIVFCISKNSFSQFEKTYVPYQFKGLIPKALVTNYPIVPDALYNYQYKVSFPDEQSKNYYSVKNYNYNQLLLSGNIFFNDGFQEYFQKLLNYLSQENPTLNNKINVFITKFDYPGSFTISEGTILLNIGLLSILQNEAQLAYILANELSHIHQKHYLWLFKRKKEFNRDIWSKSFQIEFDPGIFQYSVKHVLEADKIAVQLISNTNYNLNEITETIRLTNNGIIENDGFSAELNQLFSTPGFQPDKALFPPRQMDSLNPEFNNNFQEQANYYDGFHFDYQVKERMDSIKKNVNLHNINGNQNNIIDSNQFELLKLTAQFELAETYHDHGFYSKSMYQTIKLLNKFPHNDHLQELLIKNLFLIYKYKLTGNKKSIIDNWILINNNSYADLCYFLEKIDAKSLLILLHEMISEKMKIFPYNEELLIHAAKISEEQNNFSDAKNLYQKYIALFPVGHHSLFAKNRIK